MQVIQITGSQVRRQGMTREVKYKLTFVLFYLNQRKALIEFLREARRGWDAHRVRPDDSGFESTLLNRNLTAWVTDNVATWFEGTGIFSSFQPIKPSNIRAKFTQVSKTLDMMIGAHSGDVTGMCFITCIYTQNLLSHLSSIATSNRSRRQRSSPALLALA